MTIMNKNYIFNKKKHVILYIFEYKCAICANFNIQNHVHHIDNNHFNNDAFNLAVLCSPCHKFLHKNCEPLKRFLTPDHTASLASLNSYL